MGGFTRRGDFRARIAGILAEEVSPRRMAVTVALGVMIGILPIAGGTTLLCALLASLLRLNQAGIQAANYLAFPLQIILLVPFYHAGALLFPGGAHRTAGAIASSLRSVGPVRIGDLGLATVKALAAWLLIAPPAAALLYALLVPLFVRFMPPAPRRSGEASQ